MKVGTTRSGKPVVLKISENGFSYEVESRNAFDHNDNFDVLAILQYLAIRELRRNDNHQEEQLFGDTAVRWEQEFPNAELDHVKTHLGIATSVELVRFGRRLCEPAFQLYSPG